MMRVMILLAWCGTLALLITGCGGTRAKTTATSIKPASKVAYTKRVAAIGRGVSSSLNTLSNIKTAKSGAMALAKVQIHLRTAAQELRAVRAPDNVKSETTRLADAVDTLADELDPLIMSLKEGRFSSLATVYGLRGLNDIRIAATAITRMGYEIAPTSEAPGAR